MILIFNLVSCAPNEIFFQAEDGIRDAQESRGLGDVYKRQHWYFIKGEKIHVLPFNRFCLQLVSYSHSLCQNMIFVIDILVFNWFPTLLMKNIFN